MWLLRKVITLAIIPNLRAAFCAALIAMPLSASAFETPVDNNFRITGMGSDRQSQLLIRYRAVLFEGEMYICGAYSSRGSSRIASSFAREVLREGKMTMGETTVKRNLTFFNAVSSANNDTRLDGVMAQCLSTGISATPAELPSVRIELRSGRYRVRR